MAIIKRKARRRSDSITVISSPPQSIQLHTTARPFEDIYRSNAAVRTVIDFLGRQLGRYEAEVLMRGPDLLDHVQPPKDQLTELLRAPAPYMSRFELFRSFVSSLALTGNSYNVLVKEGDRVRYIVPVRTSLVGLEGPQDGDVEAYRLNLPGGVEVIEAEEMLHVKLWNPADPRVGVSPLESLRHLLAEDEAASVDRRRFWLNGSRPSGVIERPIEAPEWGEEARSRFRTDWSNAQQGDQTFATAVLEEGMKWSDSSRISPVDAAFVEGRTQILTSVASALGVPPQLVGAVTENVRAATALTAFTLEPWREAIEGALNAQVVPVIYGDQAIYGRIHVRLVQNPTIQDASADITTAIKGGLITPNEGRAVIGLSPLPGGDALTPAAPPSQPPPNNP